MRNWGFGSWSGFTNHISGHTFFISTYMLEPDNHDWERPDVSVGVDLDDAGVTENQFSSAFSSAFLIS